MNYGRVHSGFALNVEEILGRADQPSSLLTYLLIKESEGYQFVIQGHSRGYAIALLIATMLRAHKVKNIQVVGCGGARVGNKKFKETYDAVLGDDTYCLNAINDPVPYLPPYLPVIGNIKKISLGVFPKHKLQHYIDYLEAL
jgi:predicted lipase